MEPHRRLRSLWASDHGAAELDAAQFRQRCGPAVEVIKNGGWTAGSLPNLADPSGCPALTTVAERLRVCSVLSISLAVFAPALLLLPGWGERSTPGALSLYSTHPGAFTDSVVDSVLTATGHAALSLTAKARIEAAEQTARDLAGQLRAGLESRAVIGRAQGILMERHKITQEEAFDLLRTLSMNTNRKLRDLADEIVSTIDRRGAASARAIPGVCEEPESATPLRSATPGTIDA
ncbi:ANTAR domain-containing protein [Knoellia sinensis]|nr:ANTAR domain-containing protein [Knoellia sinensis]